MNPKSIDGSRTKIPRCNFACDVSVLRKGTLQAELKLNSNRLTDGNFKITVAKWGNSSSAPHIMHDDPRLFMRLYNLLPPHAYTQNLLLLRNSSEANGDCILLQPLAFDKGDTTSCGLVNTEL